MNDAAKHSSVATGMAIVTHKNISHVRKKVRFIMDGMRKTKKAFLDAFVKFLFQRSSAKIEPSFVGGWAYTKKKKNMKNM